MRRTAWSMTGPRRAVAFNAIFGNLRESSCRAALALRTHRALSSRSALDVPAQTERYPDKFALEADGSFRVSKLVKQSFDHHGFIVVAKLLSDAELKRITLALESDGSIQEHAFEVNDGEHRKSKMCLWRHPGNDITGMVGRSRKVAGTAAELLEGEVYHYHTKLMMKTEFTGGRFTYHQDYGYWYKNAIPFPHMLTAFIAIDACTVENGCMQVLRGSHHCGRIEHVMIGGQTGADPERVAMLSKILVEDTVELDAGDCLFFHSNLLHKSNANQSPYRRWAFLCAYNRASNDPQKEHHCPRYTPLQLVPNEAILACENLTDMTGKSFMDPNDDATIRA